MRKGLKNSYIQILQYYSKKNHRGDLNPRYTAYNEGLGINIFFIYIEKKLDIIY